MVHIEYMACTMLESIISYVFDAFEILDLDSNVFGKLGVDIFEGARKRVTKLAH